MTPYQLKICALEYGATKKAESEERLILTYLGAYWGRIKKMPQLKKLLNGDQKKKKMTPEEMLEEIKKMNASLGGSTY